MKKRKTNRITAAGIIAGTVMASAVFLPGCNRPTAVYGPPPEYDPEDNVNGDVYGPPEIFEEVETEDGEVQNEAD